MYGSDSAAWHYQMNRCDILLTLMDSWVLRDMDKTGIRFCPWFPVDSEPLSPPVRDAVMQAYERFVISKFGLAQLELADLPSTYIPHGVDTKVMKPKKRDEARDDLNIPRDAFVIGIVAANKGKPSRKAFTNQMKAFKMFKEKHPDALLYIHTLSQPHPDVGENLIEYAQYLELNPKTDIAFSDHYMYRMGYSDELMASTFNAFDVLSNVSFGEGFGVPILEAQSCGTPVVVGDWTAMSELCFAGWMVDKSESLPWWTPHATYMFQPYPEAIADRYEQAYDALQNSTTRRKLEKRARRKALEYDVDRVTETYWAPALEELENRIAGDGPENAGPMLRSLIGGMADENPEVTSPAELAMGPGAGDDD